MAHTEQQNYVASVQKEYAGFFDSKTVLDVGSLDINGNNKGFFKNCDYTGIDIAEGKNVDGWSTGHTFNPLLDDGSVKLYDTIISTECFEHDKYYALTLNNIVRLLKPGGLFLFTCATIGRKEHGTRRTDTYSSPLTTQLEDWQDYYLNLTSEDIRKAIPVDEIFSKYEFAYNEEAKDLYFFGIKRS